MLVELSCFAGEAFIVLLVKMGCAPGLGIAAESRRVIPRSHCILNNACVYAMCVDKTIVHVYPYLHIPSYSYIYMYTYTYYVHTIMNTYTHTHVFILFMDYQ